VTFTGLLSCTPSRSQPIRTVAYSRKEIANCAHASSAAKNCTSNPVAMELKERNRWNWYAQACQQMFASSSMFAPFN
jgi:hypothetical protein